MRQIDKSQLDQPYQLSEKYIQTFRDQGFIKLKNVLSAEMLEYYGDEITKKVLELNTLSTPIEERDTYHQAFLQITNLWQKNEVVKEFVMGKRLGRIATELMGTSGVRMYHDQALYKEAGGGFTPWHADQHYWPLASNLCCTAWIPLQETSLEMGPLAFSIKSQNLSIGRDIAISDESEAKIKKNIENAKLAYSVEPFDLGEVSFHYGWTFHNAAPNTTATARRVMTIIYMDEQMRLHEPANENQKIDRDVFCPGIKVGEVISTPLNPVIYSAT